MGYQSIKAVKGRGEGGQMKKVIFIERIVI